MTNGFCVDAMGVRARIDLPGSLDARQRERVLEAWSGALTDGEPSIEVPFRGGDFDAGMERLTVDVTFAALEALRGRALMFHAAGISDEDGRTAAFVGPSGRGKTTLSRVLGQRYAYVSDETIAVDSELRVHAYRKPLSLVRSGRAKEQVSPAGVGLRELPDAPLRLAALVLLDRDDTLPEPFLRTEPLVRALPEIVEQMSYLRDEDHPLQAIARLCEEIGGVRRLSYPDASTVPPLVPALFDIPRELTPWRALAHGEANGPYSAAHLRDVIDVDGDVVVMTEHQVIVLGGIAPVVWASANDGRRLSEIVADVVDAFGDPPDDTDPGEVVGAAIGSLVASDILRTS